LSSCKQEPSKYTVRGKIKGGADKYMKIIDMTEPGFVPDSIQLDLGGNFTFEKQTPQPGDYIMYFKNTDYLRVTPLPDETLIITASYYNLTDSYKITGSPESELVSQIIKQHHKYVQIIDTLGLFYMKNQLNPKLDSIIIRLKQISDSIYNDEKAFLQKFIETNPSSFAAYIALSQKVGQHRQLFTVKNDFKYFEMVDTALANRFDTIDIVKMMSAYVSRAKMDIKTDSLKRTLSILGHFAPEIALPDIYGDTLKLSSLKGKYVLVDFWGSWCRPCRKENPKLRKIYRQYRKKGFEIFQVALEHNKTDWKNTIREDKLYWKYQVSELNYMNSKIAKLYRVKAIPTNFLINPEGKVIEQNLYGEALQKKLEDIFTIQNQNAGEK
jgi:thiol-disulfide isomerase/thioredoxin